MFGTRHDKANHPSALYLYVSVEIEVVQARTLMDSVRSRFQGNRNPFFFVEPRSAKNSDHLVSLVKISQLLWRVVRPIFDARGYRLRTSYDTLSTLSRLSFSPACAFLSISRELTMILVCLSSWFIFIEGTMRHASSFLHETSFVRSYRRIASNWIRVTGVRGNLIRGWWVHIIIN